MINDLDTRFTMPQIEEILEKVASCFPEGTKKSSQIASSGVAEEDEEEYKEADANGEKTG